MSEKTKTPEGAAEQSAQNTPAVQDQNKPAKQANPVDYFEPSRERCVRLFASEDKFIEEATHLLQLIQANPSLKECTGNSIQGVLISIASTGLSLNPVMKLAYVIPRNIKVKTPGQPDRWEKRAAVEPSYMGLMKLATDSGAVRNFEVHEVYAGDEFEFDIVEKRPRVHKPYWTVGHSRGKLIGVYGFAVLADGTMIPEHMGADELAKIRSKSDNASGSVYNDWEGEMARKSLVKRLQKYIPRTEKSERFLQAVELDNASYDLDRPTGASALKPAEESVAQLQAKVREAIKAYTGADKAELKKKAADEAVSGRQNPAFWSELLFMLTGTEQE
jgi:phage RecT family recombinase